jgi:hypothetical protein
MHEPWLTRKPKKFGGTGVSPVLGHPRAAVPHLPGNFLDQADWLWGQASQACWPFAGICRISRLTMTAKTRRARKGKRDLYFDEAQSLFLAGKELEEIRELLPVALTTLKRWQTEAQWEEKRRQVPVSPRWLGEALKGILREKTGKLLARGDLKPQELDELTKIVALMDRLCSQGWDIRLAALEVMDRFSEFLRTWVTDLEERKRITHRVQEFFRQLEGEP